MRIEKNKSTFDYKWVIVAISFLMVSVCLGFCSSTKVLYVGTVPKALGVDRGLYAINDSFRFLTTAITNLFFGAMVMKLKPRKMIAIGFLSLIASCLVNSFAQSVYMVYLGGALLGFGLSLTTTSMVGYVINIWCKEQKGTIMGLVLCANGLGGAIAIQILSRFVDSGTDGYRTSYRVAAIIVLIVGVIVVSLFRDAPKGVEVTHGVEKKKAKAGTWSGITLSEALKKPYFYAAALCVFLTGLSLQGINGVYKTHMNDVQIDPALVTNLASSHSLVLAGFKFLTGLVYDKKGLRFTMLICDIAAVVCAIALALSGPTTFGIICAIAFTVIGPIALPLETIMLPLITADLFGEKDYAKLMGIIVALNTAGYAVGSPLTNAVYDWTGSYVPMFYVLAGVLTLVTIIFMFTLTAAKKEKERIAAKAAE